MEVRDGTGKQNSQEAFLKHHIGFPVLLSFLQENRKQFRNIEEEDISYSELEAYKTVERPGDIKVRDTLINV